MAVRPPVRHGKRGKHFIAGFPSQKIAFLPAGTPQFIMDAYTKAFAAIAALTAEVSAKRLGKYPMYVGADPNPLLPAPLPYRIVPRNM